MQIIENLEEGLLSLGLVARNELDIINDQHVHSLVKPIEVIEVVALHGLHILLVERVSTDINDNLIGKVDFGLDSDSVNQMRLAQSHFRVNKQRVEGRLTRSF